MRRLILSVFLVLPAPALADTFCEDLWIARNTIFHTAGFCFGSTLGKALFDTSRCTGTSPALPPDQADMVDHARMIEADLGCAVDTTRAPDARMRAEAARLLRFRDVPVPDVYGWACHHYRGAAFALLSGAADDAPATGSAPTGATLTTGHRHIGDWVFVTARDPATGALLVEGWTRHKTRSADCLHEAG